MCAEDFLLLGPLTVFDSKEALVEACEVYSAIDRKAREKKNKFAAVKVEEEPKEKEKEKGERRRKIFRRRMSVIGVRRRVIEKRTVGARKGGAKIGGEWRLLWKRMIVGSIILNNR